MIEQREPKDAEHSHNDRDRARPLHEIIALALYSESVSERTRAMFALKANGSGLAREKLEIVMQLDSSVLVRHEAAYLLGQMGQRGSIQKLRCTVKNVSEHPMVRHEAAEALSAIGDVSVLPFLREWAEARERDAPAEVRQTCRLAAARLEWIAQGGDPKAHPSAYGSIDPAPPAERRDVGALGAALCDAKEDLYERYRAMFALREIGTPDAVAQLCGALAASEGEEEGALLRHEVAFVLGQIACPDAIDALTAALAAKNENEMVRHEAAEALGAIGNQACRSILAQYRADPVDVVRESIAVALDIAHYNTGGDLHYAPVASKNTS